MNKLVEMREKARELQKIVDEACLNRDTVSLCRECRWGKFMSCPVESLSYAIEDILKETEVEEND